MIGKKESDIERKARQVTCEAYDMFVISCARWDDIYAIGSGFEEAVGQLRTDAFDELAYVMLDDAPSVLADHDLSDPMRFTTFHVHVIDSERNIKEWGDLDRLDNAEELVDPQEVCAIVVFDATLLKKPASDIRPGV